MTYKFSIKHGGRLVLLWSIINWLLLCSCTLAFGNQQNDFVISPKLTIAYNEILKLKVNAGRQLMATESAQNGFLIYLKNYADVVEILVDDDYQLYKKLTANDTHDSRIEALQKLSETSPYQRFLQAEVRLQWAFAKLKFGDEASACWDIIRAFHLLADNAKLFPKFAPTYKSLGLLHVLIGSTPKSYRWVAKMVGMSGNIKSGLVEIDKCIHSPNLFSDEAAMTKIMLQTIVTSDFDKAIAQNIEIIQQQPDNLLFRFFLVINLMRNQESGRAAQQLEKCPRLPSYLSFYLLDYLKAEILIEQEKYAEAEQVLKKFLGQYKGHNFLKDSYLKLFYCQWFRNQETIGRMYLKKIATVGTTIVESDKAAQKFSENYVKNGVSDGLKVLTMARLSCDGGFFEQTLRLLQNYSENSFKNIAEKADFQYRLGRVKQEQNRVEEALIHFGRAYSLSHPQGLHFGARAALQEGYLYQKIKNKHRAAAAFQKVLDYPKHDFKNSLDTKAQAALTEMGR